MKKLLSIATLLVSLSVLTGCKSAIAPSFVRLGVSTGVSFSVIKYPQATPFLRIAAPIICSQAGGTNLSPSEVRAAIDKSPLANASKTPEGVIALNGALGLYAALWDGYGSGVVNKYPQLRLYLQETCNGIGDALPK